MRPFQKQYSLPPLLPWFSQLSYSQKKLYIILFLLLTLHILFKNKHFIFTSIIILLNIFYFIFLDVDIGTISERNTKKNVIASLVYGVASHQQIINFKLHFFIQVRSKIQKLYQIFNFLVTHSGLKTMECTPPATSKQYMVELQCSKTHFFEPSNFY